MTICPKLRLVEKVLQRYIKRQPCEYKHTTIFASETELEHKFKQVLWLLGKSNQTSASISLGEGANKVLPVELQPSISQEFCIHLKQNRVELIVSSWVGVINNHTINHLYNEQNYQNENHEASPFHLLFP